MVVRSKSLSRSSLPRWVMRNPPLSMISAAEASVWSNNACKMTPNLWMSSSISCGKVAMSCVLRCVLADKFIEQQARNHIQRFEYALAFVRDGAEGRDLDVAIVEEKLHVFHRGDIRQIALVVLEHEGNVRQVHLQGR